MSKFIWSIPVIVSMRGLVRPRKSCMAVCTASVVGCRELTHTRDEAFRKNLCSSVILSLTVALSAAAPTVNTYMMGIGGKKE